MSKETKIILTSQEYFDAVSFDNVDLKEKVAYLLYYVTEVAKLRKDMVPKIIADRIADQYKLYCQRVPLKKGDVFEKIEDDAIADVIKKNPDYFAISSGIKDGSDRKNGEIAYRLTKYKLELLNDEFDDKIKKKIQLFDRKVVFERIWWLVLLTIIVLIGLYLFIVSERNRENIQNYSFPEYLQAVDFSKCSDVEKGIYFIYYITEMVQIREDIDASVICDRLSSMRYKKPDAQLLAEELDKSPYVMKSSNRDEAYVMTQTGIDWISNTVHANKNKESVTFGWIIDNVSAASVIGALVGLLTLLSTAFAWGFKIANILKDN